MLKKIHGGKASMLSGAAFTDKVEKLQQKIFDE